MRKPYAKVLGSLIFILFCIYKMKLKHKKYKTAQTHSLASLFGYDDEESRDSQNKRNQGIVCEMKEILLQSIGHNHYTYIYVSRQIKKKSCHNTLSFWKNEHNMLILMSKIHPPLAFDYIPLRQMVSFYVFLHGWFCFLLHTVHL